MELIYSAGKQAIKGRFVMWFVIGFAVAIIYFGLHLFRTYGTNPADGGILAPLSVRLGWALAASGFGIACALGILIWARIYIASIEIDEARQNLLICTLNLIGFKRQTVPISQVRIGNFYSGKMSSFRGQSVDAPWYTVRIEGRKLPLILDAQGHTFDGKLLREVLGKTDLAVDYRPFSE
jgi:hypothetical protein